MSLKKDAGDTYIELDSRVGSPNDRGYKPIKKKRGNNIEHYFFGPRDITRHSRIPFFFRIHGSVLPHLIIPFTLYSIWTTGATLILHFYFRHHQFDNVLLTVLGFLVGLTLSFRNQTAYSRYDEGRKYWSQLTLISSNLSRVIWSHAKEREGEEGKEDLLAKITFLNLIKAFSLAVKHRLRYEPYTNYPDIQPYISYLDTYSRAATAATPITTPKVSKLMRLGETLGITFLEPNPRAALKNARAPLGNLPLEMLVHMQSYVDSIIANGTLKANICQIQSITSLQILNDIACGTDRIANTPIPIAYSITIAQISWAYILLLPFQLYSKLKLQTIPASLLAAYIILGLATIGTEIENPFGDGVNDLPLDIFCDSIAEEVDILMSRPVMGSSKAFGVDDNMPLWPLSRSGWATWEERSVDDIRGALKSKVVVRRRVKTDTVQINPRV
ncbi:UPF0187-domain-containing protein [Microthyrium microscopicum]|uniref:UPF0187-domain-containing protein n=1 Tax=Microthyrium microscopicum TaxID=703497 RepID=A0A6A6UHN5_9PEZI|nr:UPF0187-domain-containing protein [Microthyrium microscopicum]